MKRLILLSCVLVATAHQASPANSCPGWAQVTVPILGSSDNVLAAISANSPSDIWTVGAYAPDKRSKHHPDTHPALRRDLVVYRDQSQRGLESKSVLRRVGQFGESLGGRELLR